MGQNSKTPLRIWFWIDILTVKISKLFIADFSKNKQMIKNIMKTFLHLLLVVLIISCANKESKQKTILSTKKELTAADIL